MNQQNRLRRKLEPPFESYTLSDYLLRNRLSDAVSGAGWVSVLMLDPFLVKGQVWRLVTWILIPPDKLEYFLCADHCICIIRWAVCWSVSGNLQI